MIINNNVQMDIIVNNKKYSNNDNIAAYYHNHRYYRCCSYTIDFGIIYRLSSIAYILNLYKVEDNNASLRYTPRDD